MKPACETCAHWQPEVHGGEPVKRIGYEPWAYNCQEGPVHVATPPFHRCGRWRVREDLTGGYDRRVGVAEVAPK